MRLEYVRLSRFDKGLCTTLQLNACWNITLSTHANFIHAGSGLYTLVPYTGHAAANSSSVNPMSPTLVPSAQYVPLSVMVVIVAPEAISRVSSAFSQKLTASLDRAYLKMP